MTREPGPFINQHLSDFLEAAAPPDSPYDTTVVVTRYEDGEDLVHGYLIHDADVVARASARINAVPSN